MEDGEGGTITRCCARGVTVRATGKNVYGNSDIGGLIGAYIVTKPKSGTIENSYSSCTIDGAFGARGGFIGWVGDSQNPSTVGTTFIRRCYSYCTLTGAGGHVTGGGFNMNFERFYWAGEPSWGKEPVGTTASDCKYLHELSLSALKNSLGNAFKLPGLGNYNYPILTWEDI